MKNVKKLIALAAAAMALVAGVSVSSASQGDTTAGGLWPYSHGISTPTGGLWPY